MTGCLKTHVRTFAQAQRDTLQDLRKAHGSIAVSNLGKLDC